MNVQLGKGWDRRDFLRGAALFSIATGLPVSACAMNASQTQSKRQVQLISTVSDLVIPRTDTPGAKDVGVGAFVILALEHGLEKSRMPLPPEAAATYASQLRKDGSIDHLAWLGAELDRRAGGDFLKRPPAARKASLATLDAEAFAPTNRDHPWRTLKALILTGYYTSQAGGSQELQFELVPGRFDPDLPVKPGTRASSSDWTAVDFG
ncbi:MAG: gluconate 2-dehydrogenase subunit 3 family protein [Novosphingobium sp.]